MKRNLGHILLYTLLVVSSMSCKKDEPKEQSEFPEYVVFGIFFITSGCFDNEACVEIFRLDASSLREDINDQIPTQDEVYMGNYATLLSNEDKTTIEQLFRTEIPQTLLNRSNGLVGASNGSSFFYYFEYKTPSKNSYWVIDGSSGPSLGQDMANFINVLNTAINTASF